MEYNNVTNSLQILQLDDYLTSVKMLNQNKNITNFQNIAQHLGKINSVVVTLFNIFYISLK